MRTCTNCFTPKELNMYSIAAKATGKLHARCKPCRSDINNAVNVEKKAKAKPSLYKECDDCDKIMHKVKRICSRCKSTNFSEYGK